MTSYLKRCAVYTRKSTEEGLDQAFNSLDAQAESCNAYILSQAGEGWIATGKVYLDGGISGGHMDRPGLQALIAEIEAGRIDIVVVYKVDRLTRSLSDFAKLVDLFDQHQVSFVSITQAFNTTMSMGRLTLNVLLSFAQFEREVTAERIRDKIAASKKRGQWMGGLPPLGYDNVDKQLITNQTEADIVRHIMHRYVELGSVRALKIELDQEGYVTKRRVTKKQNQIGGKPFSRGHLYKLLSNPVYIGKIKHKDKLYEGQHEPIIDQTLWTAVQSTLENNAPERRRAINIASNSLLTGLLYDQDERRLSPVHTRKPNGKLYRYYISSSLAKGEADDGKKLRLPAEEIEGKVIACLSDLLSDTTKLMKVIGEDTLNSHQISDLEQRATALLDRLKATNLQTQREALIDIVHRTNICADLLRIEVHLDRLIDGDERTASNEDCWGTLNVTETVSVDFPMQMKRRGVETKLIVGAISMSEPDTDLIKAIAMGRDWYAGLKNGTYETIGSIARVHAMDIGDVSRTLKLAFLSPSIVKDFLQGNHPVDLTAEKLRRRSGNLPVDWAEQRAFLGMQS